MSAYESLCPVVARETVEMERKEGRRWVPFIAEILWLRETAARNEYLRPGTRKLDRRGESFDDYQGFGTAVTGAARVARETAGNGVFLKNCLNWEMVVQARSREVPVLADDSPAAAAVAARPPFKTRYREVPPDWRAVSTRKPLAAVERAPERIVWSSLATAEENLLTVEAFVAAEAPPASPEPEAAPAPSPR